MIPPPTPGLPELSRVWTANEAIGNYSVRRPSGRLDTYFVSPLTGTFVTGPTEPRWDYTIGHSTADGSVTWTAQPASGFWFDNECVWAIRNHSVVLLGGTVNNFSLIGFANFGIAGWGDHTGTPASNLNGFRVTYGVILSCGGGVTVHGQDTNCGLCMNVRAVTIGYEEDGTTPIPYHGDTGTLSTRTRENSGGHGFFDDSMNGCVWIATLAESCEGRGHYDNERQANGSTTWIGPYAEQTAPLLISRGTGGGGINTSGWSAGGQGAFVEGSADGGSIDSWKVRPAGRTWPGNLYGRTNYRDLPGFWTFGDDALAHDYFGWHKNYPNTPQNMWILAVWPYTITPLLGLQYYDADDGPGLREFGVTFHGEVGNDYFTCTMLTATVDLYPTSVRRGQRVVGDRFEPPGGFLAGPVRYIGKLCITAGWDGVAYGRGPYVDATNRRTASVVVPGNGYAYQCIAVNSPDGSPSVPGALPPEWPVVVNANVIDGSVTWKCGGRVAVYVYYGRADPL